MRSLRTLTCASLVVSTLALGCLAAGPAGADAGAGYSISSIDPVLRTPLPSATFAADGAGDVVDEATGAIDRSAGAVEAFPAGSASPVPLGTAALPGVAVAGGWVAFASAIDAGGNPTQVSVSTATGSSARTVTLAARQGVDGVAGTGALILDQLDATGTQLELQPAAGPPTMLGHFAAIGQVVADGHEILAALRQSDGTWSVDHIDIGGATPASSAVESGQADEPDVFITAATYGFDDPAAHALSWQQRGSVATANVIAMPSSFEGQGQTDGHQVSWLDSSDGLVLASVGSLSTPVVIPLRNSSDAAFSPRGFLFLGGDAVVDNGLQILAADDTYSTLDALGPNLDGTTNLGLTAGRLVRWGSAVTSTPLGADGFASGAPVHNLDGANGAGGPGVVRAAGDYTVIPSTASSTFSVLRGAQSIFTSPPGSYALDLTPAELTYAANNGNEVRVRDLATGADAAVGGSQTTAGGGLLATASGTPYPAVALTPETATVVAQPHLLPLAGSPCAGASLMRNVGFFAEYGCAGGAAVAVDLLTKQSFPVPANDTLGDGVLLNSGRDGSNGGCVSVEVLTTGETTPTCLGTAMHDTGNPVFDDTGGSVAWTDADSVTHVVKVLPDEPASGAANAPRSIPTGTPWVLDAAISAPSRWTLTLSSALTGSTLTTITGSSAGPIHAAWPGQAGAGGVTWALAAVTPGGRELGFAGQFSVLGSGWTLAQPALPPYLSPSPPAKAPHLLFSLGRVKTVRGVTQLRHGTVALVTSAAGSVGCVKVVLQRLVGKRWKTLSTSRCLAATKRSTTREKLATTGSYRLELIWSLAPTKPLKVIPIRAY